MQMNAMVLIFIGFVTGAEPGKKIVCLLYSAITMCGQKCFIAVLS